MICRCVMCADCRGTGHIRVPDRTQPSGWELEDCPSCQDGLAQDGMCEECYTLERREMDALEAIP